MVVAPLSPASVIASPSTCQPSPMNCIPVVETPPSIVTRSGLVWNTANLLPHASARAPSASVQRSEEHTSELQSLMRISYAVFCLKKKNTQTNTQKQPTKYVYESTDSTIHVHQNTHRTQ